MNDWSDLRLMQINLRDGARAQYANTRWFPNSPPHNKARNQGLSLSLSHTHTHSLSLSLKRTICLRKQESRRTYIPGITMNAGALGTRRALKNFFSKRYIWNCFGRAMKTYWYVQQHMYSVTIFPDLRTPPYRTRWTCVRFTGSTHVLHRFSRGFNFPFRLIYDREIYFSFLFWGGN